MSVRPPRRTTIGAHPYIFNRRTFRERHGFTRGALGKRKEELGQRPGSFTEASDRAKNFVGTDHPYVVLWKPIVLCVFFATDQRASTNTLLWKVCPVTILRSSVAKIQRNLKMTVFQEMVIESKVLNKI